MTLSRLSVEELQAEFDVCKMCKLSELLNNVLSSIAKLSVEELQAEFDACKNGSVGRAILEGQSTEYTRVK